MKDHFSSVDEDGVARIAVFSKKSLMTSSYTGYHYIAYYGDSLEEIKEQILDYVKFHPSRKLRRILTIEKAQKLLKEYEEND